MTDNLVLGWVMGAWAGFWIGVAVQKRQARRTAPHPSHVAFAKEVIATATRIGSTQRIVGKGVVLADVKTWSIEQIGKFKITIEESGTEE